MAYNMSFSMREEIAFKLKDIKNKSGLINDLLKTHFDTTRFKTIQEIDLRLAEIDIEEEAQKKKEQLHNERKGIIAQGA